MAQLTPTQQQLYYDIITSYPIQVTPGRLVSVVETMACTYGYDCDYLISIIMSWIDNNNEQLTQFLLCLDFNQAVEVVAASTLTTLNETQMNLILRLNPSAKNHTLYKLSKL